MYTLYEITTDGYIKSDISIPNRTLITMSDNGLFANIYTDIELKDNNLFNLWNGDTPNVVGIVLNEHIENDLNIFKMSCLTPYKDSIITFLDGCIKNKSNIYIE